jgi:predicted transcriptional regulator
LDYKKEISDLGLKQSWLAKQVGVTPAMVSMFINHKATLDSCKELKLRQIINKYKGE